MNTSSITDAYTNSNDSVHFTNLQNVKKYIQVIFAEAFIQFKGQYRNFYLQIFIVNLCCDSIVVFAWIMQLCFCLLRRQRSVYALGW